MKDNTPYWLLLIGIIMLAFMPMGSKKVEKVKYCHIDSTYTELKEVYSPELMNEYWTDCDITFSSKKEYKIGDSIQIKTIIVN